MIAHRVVLCSFLLALATYIAQSTLLGLTLHVSARERSIVSDVVDAAGVRRGFTVVPGEVIVICYGIPSLRGTPCDVETASGNHGERFITLLPILAGRDVSVTPFVDSAGTTQGVVISGLSSSSPLTTLGLQCVESLTWLETFLRDANSQGIIQIVFQCWLFSISLIAVRGPPHLSSYRSFVALDFSYQLIVTKIALNIGFTYHAQLLHWLTVFLQFALFYTVASAAVWFDKRKTGIVSPYSHSILQDVAFVVVSAFASFYVVASAAARFDKRMTGIVSLYSHSIFQDVAFVVISACVGPPDYPSMVLFGTHNEPLFRGLRSGSNRGWFLVLLILSIVLLVSSAISFTGAFFHHEIGPWSFSGCLPIMADLLPTASCILPLYDDKRLAKKDDNGGRPVSPTPLHHDKSESDSSSELSKCSVHSETFAKWWLAAVEMYGPSDEEKNERSERLLDYPRFPPGLGHVAPSILESALRCASHASTLEGKEPENGDDESERLSVASGVVVQEAEVPSEACRSKPACKARL
ncbi:hypothetical protein PISMIDRAFT_19365 [Pisolithus microcarpus 441]|uniref:Uncharacterized protein n=1 Tax=Pisolithus microcarpus 441 TaxID=765257 RepID=A0A0C9XH61_9AGAM|nr:hypothetical protein BKA83DRAFT_19365 [Pisolithus microcarpus]KIK11645.1 hypothetical protein PISMIDRAFT_19365 [Pisolithus microcarpus 441]